MMAKQQFEVRIKHFADKYYSIEYAYYKTSPNYVTVEFWHKTTESWTPILKEYTEAKTTAQTFRTIEDIQAYIAQEKEKERIYLEQEKYIPDVLIEQIY